MQYPTPPTKPTPPTPPSMKKSTAVPLPDSHISNTTTPQSTTPSKAKEIPPSVPETTTNLPPLASFSNANHTAKETASETMFGSTTQLPKNNSSSTVFSALFILIFFIALILFAVHWWKNRKPKHQSTIDYSTESSEDMVNLIFSEQTLESSVQNIPEKKAQKILQQADSTPKNKGNFEVRV